MSITKKDLIAVIGEERIKNLTDLFGDEREAIKWCKMRNPEFQNRSPYYLCKQGYYSVLDSAIAQVKICSYA